MIHYELQQTGLESAAQPTTPAPALFIPMPVVAVRPVLPRYLWPHDFVYLSAILTIVLGFVNMFTLIFALPAMFSSIQVCRNSFIIHTEISTSLALPPSLSLSLFLSTPFPPSFTALPSLPLLPSPSLLHSSFSPLPPSFTPPSPLSLPPSLLSLPSFSPLPPSFSPLPPSFSPLPPSFSPLPSLPLPPSLLSLPPSLHSLPLPRCVSVMHTVRVAIILLQRLPVRLPSYSCLWQC